MASTTKTRREALQTGFAAAFLACGMSTRAFAGPAGAELERVARRVDLETRALREGRHAVPDWRAALDEIYAAIDLDDLLAGMDFEALAARTGYAERGVATSPLRLTAGDGGRLSFFPKIFAVGRGRAIIPHAHDNMVSAHLTLSGRFRLRQYDKLAVEEDAVFLRQTVDEMVGPGDLSSIGEPADNAHWFYAEENAHTFDVVVTGLNGDVSEFDIYNLDIDAASAEGEGVLRAPRLSVERALALYG
jgi:hypothetical protein